MEITNILSTLVDIHNNIIQIPVSGDGTILMANSIQSLRNLMEKLSKDLPQNNNEK